MGGPTLLLAILAGAPALAAPHVRIEATVSDDLRVVEGVVSTSDLDVAGLALPLPLLPIPDHDEWRRRTFPGAAVAGRQRLVPDGDDPHRAHFVTVLPDRGGASGRVPGHGLFANGLWHPSPAPDPDQPATLPVVDWSVTVVLPDGVTGVVGDTVGTGVLTWSGRAERVPLAVIPDASVHRHEVAGGVVTLVDHGHRRITRDERLLGIIADSWPAEEPLSLVVVETPAWRRLARPGPGVLFLSDRALRVTAPLWRYHAPAVRRGVLQAGLSPTDPWLRELAAEVVVQRLEAEHPSASPREVLGWLSWIPQIDALLYDGTLPYYGEVFDEPWPADPVADDLRQVLAPGTPGAVAARQLDKRLGDGAAAGIVDPLLAGVPIERAVEALGIRTQDLDALRAPPPAQELSVEVRRVGAQTVVELHREAPPDAPPEVVVVRVEERDGSEELVTWRTDAGPDDRVDVRGTRPRRVELDPADLVHQVPAPDGLRSDTWPRPWTMTLSFFPAELQLSDGRITAYANAILRRRYDTRWLVDLGLATDPEDLLRGEVGLLHYRGPLTDRRSRPVRLWAYTDVAVLDPGFRPTDQASIAVGASVGAALETRTDRDLPTRGGRLAVGLGGGVVPGADQRWGRATAAATGLAPLSGRLGLAGRVSGGIARGEVGHRLLSLGGSSGVRGIPVSAVVGHQGGTANGELRWQALRMASVPGWLVWLSDLQLSAGIDGGMLTGAELDPTLGAAGDRVTAVGWSGGIGSSWDVLGVRPTFLGLTAGGALWTEPTLALSAFPQIYVHLDSAF
ncbi:MAG: hypothetical protein H6742_06900 [Alphaproteobacteria bacterium]|nr:hypothetical protein [Alphaproteobacteria bacterium]